MATVEQQMSADIAPIRPGTTLVEAAQQMRISGVGALPVLDPKSEKCAAILTERDIVVRALAEWREPLTMLARDVATLQPVICSPDEDIAAVAERMREHQVQHLPVCQKGKVVGLISLADIVFGRSDQERGTLVSPPTESR